MRWISFNFNFNFIYLFFCYNFPNLALISMFHPTNGLARIFLPPFPQPGLKLTSEELHLQQGTFIQDALPPELRRLRRDEEVEWVLFSRSEIAKLSYFKNFLEIILGVSKLTSFSESLCASRTLRMMSSVKLWKLEINSFCFSISVRTPKTRARVAPTSSERFSNRSRRTVLEKEVL